MAELKVESRFSSCSAFTRAEEGGYVADRRDSGNWTSGRVGVGSLVGSNMGVGAPALLAWMGRGAQINAEQMRKLPLTTYEAIARCNYWRPLGCANLPVGLDLMVFDFGWNRGTATSLDVLVRCLDTDPSGARPTSPSDLNVALAQVPLERLLQKMRADEVRSLQRPLGVAVDGIPGPETIRALEARQDLRVITIILALTAAQVTSYRRLINFSLYGSGWLARSTRRQTAALASALAASRQTTNVA